MRIWTILILGFASAAALADVSARRRVVDPRSLKLRRVVDTQGEPMLGAVLSADARWAAAGARDGRIRVWSLAGDGGSRILRAHEGYVYALAFAPRGEWLASAGADRTVRLWDLATGLVLRRLEGSEEAVLSLAISPDGAVLFAAGMNGIRAWKTADGVPVVSHRRAEPSLAVAVTEAFGASAGADGRIHVWTAAEGKALRAPEGHTGPATCVALAAHGGWGASGGVDGKIRLWQPAMGRTYRVIDAGGPIGAVAFTRDGATVAAADHEGVRLWDLEGRKLCHWRSGSARGCTVRFSATGHALATFADGRVGLWGIGGRDEVVADPAPQVPGFLGIQYGDSGGALIDSVLPGTQAEAIGLQAGDVIVGADGTTVGDSDTFLEFMRERKEGDEIVLRVRREEQEKIFKAKLGRRP